MNATEVGALLTRVDVTYPYGTLSELEQRMRVEEWLDSAVAAFDWTDVGRLAWRRWKDQRDRPPTPHAFAEVCRQVLTAQRLDRPAIPSAPVTDEQREQNVRLVREARAAITRQPGEAARLMPEGHA